MTTNTPDLSSVKSSMDNMYRWTRHVYDASRKYYLLGRDRLINELNAKPGEIIIEAGCGTARNLIKMAQRYPNIKFYGFDASDEMLKTARESVARAGLSDRIILAQGFAQNFDPQTMFGVAPGSIDKIVFSYALSMIPPWRESLDHALALLKPQGTVHIVDFGPQDGLPSAFRAFLFWWLDMFGVHFRPELPEYIRTLAAKNFQPEIGSGLKGYYIIGQIKI
jgi:S-adenosylmethionine-diacylgycerolhomoserine-N-methlytransferase